MLERAVISLLHSVWAEYHTALGKNKTCNCPEPCQLIFPVVRGLYLGLGWYLLWLEWRWTPLDFVFELWFCSWWHWSSWGLAGGSVSLQEGLESLKAPTTSGCFLCFALVVEKWALRFLLPLLRLLPAAIIPSCEGFLALRNYKLATCELPAL